ncbi:sulfate permease, SulP family [Leifsonia sp. 98AMF]|uniref:SulP family inorganic anion transporter n=1 Tax=unclassified Leifsonia TaxID=2663824 RepID=UPI00087C7B26|nr:MULTISPECIES: SulP family inorganic anion transporter [unclassified Leifsonia]SDH35032.1 sulfate permease, SulP family [Leifsonia sp. 197AMF]SDJ00520.1 sulfate permease, SulP family [Leifsonia sp. 466MF]SDJ73655.1 sulfate permease, SulP family [Leifsonia sp. 157MF]SDO03857.1 sulfate permease, SulP family [Leifsonia sp. 509MF]SEN00108.1 sulfate permease, SulP family [Leifsonia sp. 467MF]
MRAKKRRLRRRDIVKDAIAGIVLGIESVPDGLASGLLAGVNPLAGLYAYLYGMVGAAVLTSSTFMAVQATGAMALVIQDANLETRPDPDRALFTLALMTGLVMCIAGLLKGGRLIRFVPADVMTGFITAVGVNIILGQLSAFTGYSGEGSNRVTRSIDLLRHIPQWSIPTVIVGAVTILTIVVLQRTPVGGFGLVIAVVVGSLTAAALNLWVDARVPLLGDIVVVPAGLPLPTLPSIGDVPYLLIPAVSLALVGLIQGAGVSAGIPTATGRPANASRDFIGQGVGNIVSGLFRGMPVGGSMSGSSLLVTAGARSKLALFVAGVTMALVIVFASGIVALTAMPALAGLLMTIGYAAIKPSRVYSVVKSGILPTAVMTVTFVLTLVIPLQFAVLAGVGLGIILFVARQSNRLRVRQVHLDASGGMRESDPPATVGTREVIVLQPYGSLFFASAPSFERQLPSVDEETEGSVVIIRLRGTDELDLALIDSLRRYARSLAAASSRLKLVISEAAVRQQLAASGLLAELGEENVYQGTEWIGKAVQLAWADAQRSVARE